MMTLQMLENVGFASNSENLDNEKTLDLEPYLRGFHARESHVCSNDHRDH
jgi:hypothetical protein